jgi:hypothetical protein
LIGFEAVLLLLHQNKKYEVAHTLAHLPCLDIVMGLNGKSRNSMAHLRVAV